MVSLLRAVTPPYHSRSGETDMFQGSRRVRLHVRVRTVLTVVSAVLLLAGCQTIGDDWGSSSPYGGYGSGYGSGYGGGYGGGAWYDSELSSLRYRDRELARRIRELEAQQANSTQNAAALEALRQQQATLEQQRAAVAQQQATLRAQQENLRQQQAITQQQNELRRMSAPTVTHENPAPGNNRPAAAVVPRPATPAALPSAAAKASPPAATKESSGNKQPCANTGRKKDAGCS